MRTKVGNAARWLWERARLNPLFYAAAASIAAVAATDHIGWNDRWLWVGLLALLLPSLIATGRKIFLIGSIAASFALLHAASLKSHATKPQLSPGTVLLSGRVVGFPENPPGSDATLFRLDAGENGTFLARVANGGKALETGDTITVRAELSTGSPARNPNGFNTSEFFQRKQLSGQLRITDDASISTVSKASSVWSLGSFAADCRNWLAAAITAGIPSNPNSTALIQSMVLGARDSISPELEIPFRYSGTMHLFAISGLHVGIFTSIAWFALRLLSLRRDHAAIILIPIVFFYAFITGWRPSAVRAAVMLSVVLVGAATNRQPRLFNSLGAAALIVLAWDTHQLFLPGFQLSFIVLFAIALLADPFRICARRMTAPDPFLPTSLLSKPARTYQSVIGHLGTYVSVSLAAWLGSLYPVWYHFGLVTPVSIIANIILIPAAYGILFTAAISASATLVASQTAIPLLLNQANAFLATSVIAIAGWFAELPGAHFHVPNHTKPADTCTVTVLDVGYGGACHVIEPPAAHASLIDTGSGFDFQETIRRFLASHGIDKTDRLFLTHPDSHHLGGAPGLLTLAPPQETITTAHASRSPLFSPIVGSGNPWGTTSEGDRFDLAENTWIEILYPPAHLQSGIADSSALVARLHYGRWRVLFMSDSGFETEKYLLESRQDLGADVIVMGRHRSDLSGAIEFIRAVAPAAVITTSSRFPAHENVPRNWRHDVTSLGVRLFDQSVTGAVSIDIAEGSLTLRPFVSAPALTLDSPQSVF